MRIKAPNLTDYQKEFLYQEARFTIVEASTKSGKTFSHIWWLFEYALGHQNKVKIADWPSGAEFWWVAPVYQQAKIAFNRLSRYIGGSEGYSTNQSELFIRTPLNTFIRFKTADKPDNLYGEDVYGFVFDEFTRAKQEAWFALRSTLTHTRGKGKFIGNYTGDSGWGHQLAMNTRGNPNYKYFLVTAMDAVRAGVLKQEEVDQARKDLPKAIFDALYNCIGQADDSQLFTYDKLKDIWTNTPQKGTKYISCDIAMHGSDRFVLMLWDGWHIEKIKVFDKIDGQEIVNEIQLLATENHVNQSNIVFDADGIGAYLKGYLKNAYAFNNGGTPLKQGGLKPMYSNLKNQCIYLLSENIEKVSYHEYDYKEEIMAELGAIRKVTKNAKLSTTSKDDIKDILGRSPDISDTMIMRCVFDIKNKSGDYLLV